MSKLLVTRGLPAAGKTTFAHAWVSADRAHRVRVNRDDLRVMVDDNKFVKGVTEQRIVAARDALISSYLRKGYDVINDDTNLRSHDIRDHANLARKAGAEFEIKDMSDVDLETCVLRNAQRSRLPRADGKPGEAAIRDMWTRLVKNKGYPLPVPEISLPSALVPYIPLPGKPSAYIVDIDGTVALMGDRSPYDESLVHLDKPNTPVVRLLWALQVADKPAFLFVSGRTDSCREASLSWLDEHVGFWWDNDKLFMRATGDSRKDSIVKAEIFDEHIRDSYNILGAFDDRTQVVEMWRALGLTVFQVAEGAF